MAFTLPIHKKNQVLYESESANGTLRLAQSGLHGNKASTGRPSNDTSRQLNAGVQAASRLHPINATKKVAACATICWVNPCFCINHTAIIVCADNHPMNSLDGIRILDLSRVLAGPWCTQTLADLGAEVIKIERPMKDGVGGDDTRGWGPPFLQDAAGQDTAEAAYYLGTNRNKRSVAVDISTPQGQQTIRDLVLHCDVFVENFKVGDMARYGLDYATL